MPTYRYWFETRLSIQDRDRGSTAPKTFIDRKNVDYFRRQTVIVPAGKARCVTLHDKTLSAATDAKFLWLAGRGIDEQNTGIQWWPIDSTAPEVDEDVKNFGWLLDWAWPFYEHDHGDYSDVEISHLAGGSGDPTMFETLPCFQGILKDRTGAKVSYNLNYYSDLVTGVNDARIADGDVVQDMSVGATASYKGQRRLLALLGPGGKLNLGTGYDSLEFFPMIYMGMAAANGLTESASAVRLALFSYPYTNTRQRDEDVPALTPAGYVPFASDDPLLDTKTQAPAATSINRLTDLPYFVINNAGSILREVDTAGTRIVRLPKTSFSSNNATANAFSGGPTWNRITMLEFGLVGGWTAPYDSDEVDAYLVNIYFGPRPNRLRILRPFEYTTDTPWSIGNRPAIGLKNNTGLDAEIEICYGGI